MRLTILSALFLLSVSLVSGDSGLTASTTHSINPAGLFPSIQADGDYVNLRMQVGTMEEHHRALPVAEGDAAKLQLPGGDAGDYLLVQFVIPDDLDGHSYDLSIYHDDELIHERSGHTRGFGLRSIFVPLETRTSESSLRIQNNADGPLYLGNVSLLPNFADWLDEPIPENDFVLALLVGESLAGEKLDRVAQLHDAPQVRKAISHEIYYAVRSNEQIEETARATREVCEEMDLDFVAATCSWWAGTPPVIRKRIDFQQICWSETDDYDEGEALREMLGDKWDIRYGLTIPNKWSSTPWQTMNHPELNAMRRERNEAAVRILEEHLGDKLQGYISENEPAYWAFEGSDNEYPVRRNPLWADFNPVTVEDAEKDGITLDPSDGLDLIERAWLHYNVAHYNEENIASIHQAKPTVPVYSHALLDYNHFPFHGTGHARPYAEVARVSNALLGVEMIWGTDMDALWRVREWGRWSCVNREEYDGWPIEFHIATLRANYVMGSDMYNSYNWHRMGREGNPVEYFNTFIDEVRNGGVVSLGANKGAERWVPFFEYDSPLSIDESFPWFNRIELKLRANAHEDEMILRITHGEGGNVVAFAKITGTHVNSEDNVTISFGDLPQLPQKEEAWLNIETTGEWEAAINGDEIEYEVLCDMSEERRRSQFITGQADDSKVVPLLSLN